MIEKQETYQPDHDWKAEEKNKSLTSDSSWEKKELEKEIDLTKMIHKEVTGYDRKEMKSHIDEFPSKSSSDADVCSEFWPTNKSRFVVQLSEDADSFQEKHKSKPSQASVPEANSDVAPGSQQIKEHTASKQRKKRRPQSLNLGMPAELIYSKGGSDSSGEEIEGSDSDISPEKTSQTEIHCESSQVVVKKDDQGSGKDHSVRVYKDSKLEEISTGESREISAQGTEQVKRKVSQVGTTDIDLGSVNGPGKLEHDSSLAGIKGECVMKVRGKGLIDNKELAEVKLRQVRTHERKISSSGAEDIEGFMGERGQRTSFHRLSGSSYQSEITRIVPLKPERSKSVACKDERDRTAQDDPTQVIRREYRWSVGSPEGSSDLNWTDVSTLHSAFAADLEGIAKTEQPDDSYPIGRGPTESQSFGSKISALPKMAPPAPPVKTQKARESGLILRNSRNVARDPSLDAAKKRHSVTLLGICYSVIGSKASHELQTDSHTIFLFFYVFSDLKHSSILPVRACVKSRRSSTFAPSCGKNQSKSLDIFPYGNLISPLPLPSTYTALSGKSVQLTTGCES